MTKRLGMLSGILLMGLFAIGQIKTNNTALSKLAEGLTRQYQDSYLKTLKLAIRNGWSTTIKLPDNQLAVLVGIDAFNMPKYYVTVSNVNAAATTRANQLWPGGSSGLNLTGSSAFLRNKLGIWDGGFVLNTHQELLNRVEQRDANRTVSDHGTHVAGTMIATGINANAKGMAYQAPNLLSWDFSNDISEIAGAASGLILSNHSYGILAGWTFNSSQNRWEFRGEPGADEDYKFGYYSDDAQALDSISYLAPYYLIVKAAGNSRNQNGPAVGQTYFRFNATGQMVSAGARPAGMSSNDGYDIISWDANAKNILTVGAVNAIPNGYNRPSDVVISNFSSWGPTDDGRIKPDIVGNGVGVFSTIGSGNDAYASLNGTSMASPNVTGSLLLLQEHFAKLNNGNFMRSATLKGLAIHTADEAGGSDGPDYIYGWGLLNVLKAAEVISATDGGPHMLKEEVLNNSQTKTYTVTASGRGKLIATICWTDVKGTVETTNRLNNRTPKLVNDLDIKITRGTETFLPWKLDPANPANAATKGDNIVDNVEKVEIENAIPGEVYTITVKHKGSLVNNSQAYAILVSGVGGSAICNSAASSTNGTRIDSTVINNVKRVNVSGCTSYNSFKNTVIQLQPNMSVPFQIGLSSCDATTNNRIAKIFIDYNCNNAFEANELVATSAVLTGRNASFSGSFTTPFGLIAGNTATLRVIVQETDNAENVQACGSYANGETQDYLVKFVPASNDLAVFSLVAPLNNTCADNEQLVVVQLQNKGSLFKNNIPVRAIVRNTATNAIVANITGTYPGFLDGGNSTVYTLQKTFATEPGNTYEITVIAATTGDQDPSNDTLKQLVTIQNKPTNIDATARICGGSAILRVNNAVNGANYFWYDSPTSTTPIARGSNTSTTKLNTGNTYYVSSGARAKTGLTSKNLFPNGGGYLTSNSTNYLNYTSTVPLVLESARLYIRYPGKINFYAADLVNNFFTFLSQVTIDVYATSADPQPGAQGTNFDNADTGAIYQLNLPLPAGSHLILAIPQGDANIFRHNNIPETNNTYPITVPELISITGNGANPQNSFYYYLYDMKVKTADCISDRFLANASVAPTPTITQVGDTLISSIPTGNQWFSGVGGTSLIGGATAQKFRPSGSGYYSVAITDNVGCRRASADFTYLATAINPNPENTDWIVGPNPSNGSFRIQWNTNERAALSLQLVDISGKIVQETHFKDFTGRLNLPYKINNPSSGSYWLQLQHGKTRFKKLIQVHN